MRHGILFFSSLVLLAGAAGGIFVLVHQGGPPAGGEIAEEVFVASVHMEEVSGEQVGSEVEPNIQEAEVFEAKLQTTQPMPKPAPPPTPTVEPKPSPVPVIALPPTSTPTSTPPASMPQPPPQPPPPAPPAEKININTANLEELGKITGVGPAIAQRIIDYRNMNGLFYRIEDLKNVSGIGDVNFEKMKDEITVGNVAPPPAGGPAPSPQAPEAEKININTANYEELLEITGVGEVIAQRIIDYRTQNGPFQTIEEIKDVKGIGDATFEKMKDEITI